MRPFLSRLAPALVILLLAAPAAAQQPAFRYPAGKHGTGELKYVNGVPVLVVAGTPEEIGAAEGVLGVKPMVPQYGKTQQFLNQHGVGLLYPVMLRMTAGLATRFPPDHLRETEAMAKAAGISREMAVFINTIHDLMGLGGCSALLIEPGRSASGETLFGRNLDWPPFENLHEYTLVTVYKPRGKHAFASIGYPGMIGPPTGMNDAGLCLGTLEVRRSKDGAPRFDPTGTPYLLGLRRVLEECSTVEEAEKLLKSMKRATMHNLAICDKNTVAVFEVTPRSVHLRRAEHGIAACTNDFRCADLAVWKECRRFAELEKSRGLEKVSFADVAKHMDAVHQGRNTMQAMVFEPSRLRLHLAYGMGPATRLPKAELNLGELFGKQE